jgi:hypothetical protein
MAANGGFLAGGWQVLAGRWLAAGWELANFGITPVFKTQPFQ